jgi:uncharacterized membrane protein
LVKLIKEKMPQITRFLRTLPIWSIIFFSSFLIIEVCILMRLWMPDNLFNGSADSARYLLSAVAQSQAAIVAIVSTLTLIAVQLASQTYSPRLMDLFLKGWQFWSLLFIFGISIMYDVVFLSMIPPQSPDAVLNVTFHICA